MKTVILTVTGLLLCFCSFALMQRELEPEKAEKMSFGKLLLPKDYKRFIYLAAMLVLNAALLFMFLAFYRQENVVYIAKRIGLAIFVCGIMPVDLKQNRIPNVFILAIVAWRTLCLLCELIWYREGLSSVLLQEIVGAGIFLALVCLCMLIAKNSIGMGDLKLILVMAACQGLYGLLNSLFVALFIAFFAAIFLLLTRKKGRKDVLPFAPCIMPGLYIAMFLCGV